MNKRAIGARYEKMAAEYLKKQGLRILEMNFRNRQGEIDIIAEEDVWDAMEKKSFKTICFVEVKYRWGNAHGAGYEAVDWKKRMNIAKVARYYLMTKGYDEWTPARFDIISIEEGHLTYLRNAFDGEGR